jgi:protein LTV1
MPPKKKRTFEKGSGTKYIVINRPCEDLVLDNENHAETMLVPAYETSRGPAMDEDDDGEGTRPRLTAVRFGEDVHDEGVDELFEEGDEDYESEIDQDFIQEMMKPDPNYVYTVFDELPQRKTQKKGVLEKQFENAMKQFEFDGNLEADDARVQGPIDVARMDEGNWHIDESTFQVMPTRSERINQEYDGNRKELAELTKQYLRQNEEKTRDDEEEKFDVVQVPHKKDRWDCETILSTYSNLYNHPRVIMPASKTTSVAKRLRRRNVSEPEEEESQPATTEASVVYIPQRTANETPEDKRERRKLVKVVQQQRRQTKKQVTLMYRSEGIRQGLRTTKGPTPSVTMSLS